NAGNRIERCLAEGWIEGAERSLEIATLDQIVTLAARIVRQTCFRRFGVGKNTGLVRTLVDRRAANLGEPDGFRLRQPGRRTCQFGPANPLVMRLRPEMPNILLPENPRFAATVGDRGPGLRVARSVVGVEPVIGLAT